VATGMEFCLLGPLTVRCGGTAVALPRGRQRALLVALLLRSNHVVSVDELAEALWGPDLPPLRQAYHQPHTCRQGRPNF
jgi:DNA-binding SARP family transcriptional activator